MYRVTVECISVDAGPANAADIEQEFREHRTWWAQPQCTYADGGILLVATSDFDENGMALLDEFGDCLVAYIGCHGKLRVRSVERV